jgi:type I restriction enzyme S subunit
MSFENTSAKPILSNVCTDISYGYTASAENEPIGPKFLRITDIQGGIVSWSTVPHCQIEQSQISKYLLHEGDIVVARTGNSTGENFIFTGNEIAVFASYLIRLRVDHRIANPYFIWYQMRSPFWWKFINSSKTGSAQAGANAKVIASFEISLPSLIIQQNVVSVLRAIDDRIALLRETNATLEAIAQALFKSWFVDFDPVHAKQEGREPEGMNADTAALFPDSFEESELGLIPKGWTVKCLRDITNRITKGTTPTTLKRPFVASGINFIKVESLTEDGEFIPGKFAYIDNETHELLKRSQLQVDDVLITIAGTIGRIAVMTEDFLPANTNQAVALIRPDPNRFPGGLIKHFLQRDDSRQNMVERVVQAVQANLSLGSISDLKVVVPPSEVVKQLYDAGISQIDACKNRNQKHIRTLTNIRDALLPRLISGRLRLPEAETQLEEVGS